MIQVNRIYLIFNRLVTKKFLVDTSDNMNQKTDFNSNVVVVQPICLLYTSDAADE